MASSTLLYIAWPLTLGLSFVAGGMILSKKSTTQSSKNGNQPSKILRRNPPSNSSKNENSTAITRRSSTARSRIYGESYDIKEIANINDSHKRLTNLLRMIDQLGTGDFEQVITDFPKFDMTARRRGDYNMLLTAWAKKDPQGALAYAKENKLPDVSSVALSTWAEYAPNAAIQWLELNHKGDKASAYLIDIIKGVCSTSPERATGLLQKLSNYTDRLTALAYITPQISKLGSEKAIAWLATINNEEVRTLATMTLVQSLARKDPQTTVDWLKTLPAKTQKNHAPYIARTWAEQDIDKAVEWTSSLEGHSRIRAAAHIIDEYLYSDPNKAATWMKTMSGEPGYTNLVSAFIDSAKYDHPELALANLDQLNNLSYSRPKRAKILRTWAAKDKAAASLWMQNNNIGAIAQKNILSAAAKDFYSRSWIGRW